MSVTAVYCGQPNIKKAGTFCRRLVPVDGICPRHGPVHVQSAAPEKSPRKLERRSDPPNVHRGSVSLAEINAGTAAAKKSKKARRHVKSETVATADTSAVASTSAKTKPAAVIPEGLARVLPDRSKRIWRLFRGFIGIGFWLGKRWIGFGFVYGRDDR